MNEQVGREVKELREYHYECIRNGDSGGQAESKTLAYAEKNGMAVYTGSYDHYKKSCPSLSEAAIKASAQRAVWQDFLNHPIPDDEQPRTLILRLRVSPAERAVIADKAKREHRTLSQYIRSRCL